MTLTIVVLNSEEEFLQFLDTERCDLKESCKANGLRTLDMEYKFEDMKKDKELFRLGNKIWVQGDTNLTDCLYVINTKVKQDIFKENSFTLDLEEVLVELTYAPLISQTDITSTNGFKISNTNGEETVRIDYNSLYYWFGDYFNIGVVQNCLSNYAQYITVTGTLTPMALLRQIEEDTGNVFITRYEKDCNNNTIHRYLDFLNPIDTSKNWSLNLEYKFVDTTSNVFFYDSEGNLTSEDKSTSVTPYSSDMPSESLNETSADATHDGNELYEPYTDTPYTETWIASEQLVTDPSLNKDYTPIGNLNPSNTVFRITDGTNLLYSSDDTPLQWTSNAVEFTNNTQTAVISLIRNGTSIGISVNNKTITLDEDNTDTEINYVNAIKTDTIAILEGNNYSNVTLPDDSYLEIYDTTQQRPLFQTLLNTSIGYVHEQVLDLGFNLENVEHEIDETDTYTAVAPVLELKDTDNDTNNNLSRTQLGDLIERWRNLKITKGETIPMIVERITVTAPSLNDARNTLGTRSRTNWWVRPYNPNDNTDSEDRTYEFLRATAYWEAPYNKHKGDLYVETNKTLTTEYTSIHQRKDNRNEKGMETHPKAGTTTSTDEDLFQIYNQVSLYLKDHEEPDIDLDLDVANLRGMEYNNYQIWDKVYVKIPDTEELIPARVTELTKEAHDIAKNTIKVTNTQNNTLKVIPKNTILTPPSKNNFTYPNTRKFTVRLENTDYTSSADRYPKNKLINFRLYKVENGSLTFRKNTTKKTDQDGKATITMKYLPGDYKMVCVFGGDEEFSDCTCTSKINVGGVAPDKSDKNSTDSSKSVVKTTYYDKYGRSPDNKKILAIGRRSNGHDAGEYKYFYGQEFKNYCPKCKHEGTLAWSIFYAGNEHANKGKFPATGKYEGSSAEGAIVCTRSQCDSDWSCQGHEHGYKNTTLTTTKKRFLSSKADAYKLKRGEYVYEKVTTTNDSKTVGNSKTRKVVGKLSATIKNKALEIVDEKTGQEAMKAICTWMDKNIRYASYPNFKRTPEYVLKKGSANCCDGTRLFLCLCDGAGLTEYYELYYVHVPGHVYAIVKSKKTGTKTCVDNASDYHACWGYVCSGYTRTTNPSSRYPTRPRGM